MTDTRVVATSPLQSLREDHRIFKELFAEYANLDEDDTSQKGDLFREIHNLLVLHEEIEEQLFYPAIRGAINEAAEGIVNEAIEAHQSVTSLMEEMSVFEAGDAPFEARMKVLRESVERHAGEEEKEMFPLVKTLPRNVQEILRADMESLRNDLQRDLEE